MAGGTRRRAARVWRGSQRRVQPLFGRGFILRLGISLGLATGAGFVRNSVFDGILVGVAAIALDLMYTLGERVLTEARLTDNLRAAPRCRNAIEDVADSIASIYSDPVLQPFIIEAEVEIGRSEERFQDMAGREIEIAHLDEFEQVLLSQIKDAQLAHIRATSYSEFDLNRWTSDRDYWNENIRAIRRGVTIERIFIYKDTIDENLTGILNEQAREHVHVYAMERQSVREALKDFIVWDERCTAHFDVDFEVTPTSGVLSVKKPLIKNRIKLFDDLQGRADRWETETAAPPLPAVPPVPQASPPAPTATPAAGVVPPSSP